MTRHRIVAVTVLGVVAILIGLIGIVRGKQPRPADLLSSTKEPLKVDVSADCVAVENEINDNGCSALKCASGAFPQLDMRFDNTRGAITQLSGCLKQKPGGTAMIIGHGLPGMVATGEPSDDENLNISINNEKAWGPLVNIFRGKEIPLFTLLGCYTGYSGRNDADHSDGVQLLKKLVTNSCKPNESCKTKARAPTGNVLCVDKTFYFAKGVEFQEGPVPPSSIAHQPDSKDPPQVQQFIKILSLDHKREKELLISSNQILDIVLETKSLALKNAVNLQLAHLTTQAQIKRFLGLFDSVSPQKEPGCPISGTLGYATFTFRETNHLKSSKAQIPMNSIKFEILKNGFMRDTSRTDINVFYQGTLDIATRWRSLF